MRCAASIGLTPFLPHGQDNVNMTRGGCFVWVLDGVVARGMLQTCGSLNPQFNV